MENIKTAIEVLAKKAQTAPNSHEAMQYAQATLSLSHTAMNMTSVLLQSKPAGETK
jgi:hypothetical protein